MPLYQLVSSSDGSLVHARLTCLAVLSRAERGRVVDAQLSGTTWLTVEVHVRASCGGWREGGSVGHARVVATNGLGCCYP